MWKNFLAIFKIRKRPSDSLKIYSIRLKEFLSLVLKDKIRFVKYLLMTVLAILLLVFFYGVLCGEKIDISPNTVETDLIKESETTKKISKPFSYYSNIMGRKKLFSSSAGIKSRSEIASAIKGDSKKMLDDLVLLGIYLDEKPQAIVEDLKDKKTYFLYEGDFIRGMLVEKILKGKIILRYQNQSLELVL